MSDKELALDSIQRLPPDAKLKTIAERLEFLAAIRKGFDGRAVPVCRCAGVPVSVVTFCSF
jgi:hypothetical protein